MIFTARNRMKKFALLFAGTGLLCACEGRVSIQLGATPPEDWSAAVLQIGGVALERADGGREVLDLDSDRQIDTKSLARGVLTTLLKDQDIAAGDYIGIELLLAAEPQTLDSYLEASDGGQTPLRLSSGSRAFASRAFSLRDDEDIALTLHFDLRASLLSEADSNGDRLMTPRLRLVESGDKGSISGDVDVQLFRAAGCAEETEQGRVMYVFSGHNVVPDDLDGQAADPLSSGLIRASDTQSDYVIAALPAGAYTRAASCDADQADPVRNDTLNFVAQRNVTLDAGTVTTQNFEP